MERREKVSGVRREVKRGNKRESEGEGFFSAQNCMLRVNASATHHAPSLHHRPRASFATCHLPLENK